MGVVLGPGLPRATVGCSRGSGSARLEVAECLRSAAHTRSGSLRCQPAGDRRGLLPVTYIQPRWVQRVCVCVCV